MRVALIGQDVFSDAPPAPDRVGRWLGQMLSRRHSADVHYLLFAPHLHEDQIVEHTGMTVHQVACPGRVRFALRQYFGPGRLMARALARLGPDVVHSEYLDFAPFGLDAGIPTVVTVHGIYHKEMLLNPWWRRMAGKYHLHFYWKALRRMRHVISISPYVEQELHRHTNATFWNIPNPINPRFLELDPDRAEPGRFLYVGLLIPRKCVLELLRAFSQARRRRPEIRLRLIGDSRGARYARRLREYVAAEGLAEAVTFLGRVSEQELLDEVERASALVLMSRQETAPGVISEAMAAGTAVISVRICGIPYMVEEGRTGTLVDPGDVAGFARSIAELAQDHAQCREMGRRGREKAIREFHPERVADETLRVYKCIIGDATER